MRTRPLKDLVAGLEAPDMGRQVRLRSGVSRARLRWLRKRRRHMGIDAPPRPELPAADVPLGILRPGFNNFGPSAPFVFAFARRHERTLLAYACDGIGPRILDAVDGVAVPADLRGRIAAVGSPDWCVLSFEASSDLFLRQLLKTVEAELPWSEGRPILSSGARFLGHSQGALEGLIDRARLRSAGLGDVIGEVLGLAPPAGGAAILRRPRVATALAQGAATAGGRVAQRAVEDLSAGGPARVLARHGAHPDEFDRVLAGRIGTSGGAFFRALGWVVSRKADWSQRSDGLVAVDSTRHGVREERFRMFPQDIDHDRLFEDPSVVEAALA